MSTSIHPIPELVDRIRQEYANGKPISELLEIICQTLNSKSKIICVFYISSAFGIGPGRAGHVAMSEIFQEGGRTSAQLQESMVAYIEERKQQLAERYQ
ncbi:hypothetical protein EON83_14680 [bacterium]|nr:MAG: hypothetical protein EON83_14680 [bacterium]